MTEAAHDLDAVRAALGYEQLNLQGGSFGTRAAQVYMRMYPHRVRSAVLHGVVTPSMASPQSYAHDFQAALNGVIADCAADAACGAAFPRLADEAKALEERMRRGSATATLLDVEAGTVQVELSRGTVAETLRKLLYAPVSAGRLPLVVHRAAHGDFGLLAREAIGDRRRMQGGASWGLFLAVTCSEDLPFVDTAAARATDATTLLGAYRVREAVAACEGWPTAALPPGYRDPVRSDAPVLIISGERDPVTGPRWGEAAAAHLPNSVHLVVPRAAHSYGGMPGAECVDSAVIAFMRSADPRAVDTTCLSRVRRPPWVLEVETTLALDSAALARFAGEYASPEPAVRMTVEARPGGLRAQLGNGPPLYLVATAPTRFYPEGWPPGATVEFVLDDDAVAQVVITGGGPPMQLVPVRRP
jgi:pimeloyl-ACP methyl ester carboxylesterase